MSGFWDAPNDYQDDQGTFSGSAHSVSSDPPEKDRVERLREVVEEITRKHVPRPERRIGFVHS